MPDRKRVALVTGAARGIGEATAVGFSQAGYQVVGVDQIEQVGASGLKTAIAREGLVYAKCDVGDERQVERLVGQIVDQFETIDVLVNNAGVVLTKPLTETDLDDFERIFGVNVGGPFLMCKHVVPVMRRNRRGSIVNLASVSAYVGSVNNVLYCASKGAVLAFTKALAVELAQDGIRVNSISPGYIDTPMLRDDLAAQSRLTGLALEEIVKREEGGQLFKRFASPTEVAEAIFFLANDGASFITGADLLVDCGWVAR